MAKVATAFRILLPPGPSAAAHVGTLCEPPVENQTVPTTDVTLPTDVYFTQVASQVTGPWYQACMVDSSSPYPFTSTIVIASAFQGAAETSRIGFPSKSRLTQSHRRASVIPVTAR